MADQDEEQVFDSNAAISATNGMWERFAVVCEGRAFEKLADKPSALDLETAHKFARYAEAAYWQATGDADTFDFKHKRI